MPNLDPYEPSRRIPALASLAQGAKADSMTPGGRTVLENWSQTPLIAAASAKKSPRPGTCLPAAPTAMPPTGLNLTHDVYLAPSPEMPEHYRATLSSLQPTGPKAKGPAIGLPDATCRYAPPPAYDPERAADAQLKYETQV